jgi:hypothetical protein
MWAKIASWIGIIITLVFSFVFAEAVVSKWVLLARRGAFTFNRFGALLVLVEIIVPLLLMLNMAWPFSKLDLGQAN